MRKQVISIALIVIAGLSVASSVFSQSFCDYDAFAENYNVYGNLDIDETDGSFYIGNAEAINVLTNTDGTATVSWGGGGMGSYFPHFLQFDSNIALTDPSNLKLVLNEDNVFNFDSGRLYVDLQGAIINLKN